MTTSSSSVPNGFPVVSFLEIDGRVLSGEELEEYCKDHGLCKRCAKVKTHRRVLKLFRTGSKWEPMTIHNERTGEVKVYKGYCLSPTCYTLSQAKRLTLANAKQKQQHKLLKSSKRFNKQQRRHNNNNKKKPSMRRAKTNPETGSVISNMSSYTTYTTTTNNNNNNNDDDMSSVLSGISGISDMSGFSGISRTSTTSFSAFSGFGSNFGKKKKHKKHKKQQRMGGGTTTSSSNYSISSNMSVSTFGSYSYDDDYDDNFTIDSKLSSHQQESLTTPTPTPLIPPGQVSPIIKQRLEQLVQHDNFVVLDLTKLELRKEDIDAICNTLSSSSSASSKSASSDASSSQQKLAFTLETINLNKCKLRDDGFIQICQALEQGGNYKNLKHFNCRQNRIANKGVMALEFLLQSSCTLETLDLSDNTISSKGASHILNALQSNPNSILHTLNLSQNEIWDIMDNDGSYLRTTKTLKVFNMDGNFMHDEGAEQIAKAITQNKDCVLEKLYLGWNGICDDGAIALAKMMETNNSLQILGLSENDISNTGARAILSALAINTSLREISGLYHNQIDRKFIIVAIKRLLHRYGEQRSGGQTVPVDMSHVDPSEVDLDTHDDDIIIGGGDEIIINGGGGVMMMDHDDDDSIGSGSSLNWANQMYSDERNFDEKDEKEEGPSIALEAIEHWDWGTFGIEEMEASSAAEHQTTTMDVPLTEPPKPELAALEEASPLVPPPRPTSPEVVVVDDALTPTTANNDVSDNLPVEDLPVDRLTIFQSAPLAFFNRDTAEHHAVPIFDFDYEARALKEALSDVNALGGKIELNVENVTAGRLKVSFLQGTSRIMHFSGHGQSDCVALENGFGYMQALPTSDLKRFVQRGGGKVQVVVLISCYARSMAESFLEAGVPHVVCCQRETVFRDEGPIEFSKGFYQALASNKTLKQAFKVGLDAVKRSPSVKLSGNMAQKYCLLPEKPSDDPYHDVQVFYQRAMRKITVPKGIDNPPLPELPEQFVGREVDMYEILESLRVDDVVRVGGAPGCGKASVISAVSRYILERPKSFKIDNVYWLPSPQDDHQSSDPVYQELCEVMDLTMKSEDCIWDEDDFIALKNRLTAALKEKHTILVVDGRCFTSEAAGENLEKLLTHLLNEASVKIVLLTAIVASRSSKTKSSRSEETMVNIGPLDLRSSALLFGKTCKHLASTHFNSAEEFADYLVPSWMVTNVLDEKRKYSRRHKEIHERLGKGNPRKIAEAASSFTEKELSDLLRFAKRPEINVESAAKLEAEVSKWSIQKDRAIKGMNYSRAQDIVATLEELESLRSSYPKEEDLSTKEADYKERFKAYLKAKEYSKANAMKRKILELKKLQLKEKHEKQKTKGEGDEANEKAKESKKSSSADEVVAMTEKLHLGKSISQLDVSKTLQDDADRATMKIVRETDICYLNISVGSVLDFSYADGMSGIVCWSNEACNLSMDSTGKKILEAGGSLLEEKLDNLETQETTEWGPVKCSTGDAIMLGPLVFTNIPARMLFLAVGPFDQDWDGNGWNKKDDLHFLDTEMRASYRSIFQSIGKTEVEAVGIQPLTSKQGSLHERTSWVGLKTLVEAAKHSKLGSIYLYASSQQQANLLIKMAFDLGLSC